jgi:hypothetical protein
MWRGGGGWRTVRGVDLERRQSRRSTLSKFDNALLIVAVVVAGIVALSIVGWVIGAIVGLVWFVVKVAVVGLIIGLIVRAVAGRR